MSKKLIKRSKKEVHAQSAMEYLLTYGWSILIIAIALVTLFELGYFNGTNSTLPSECIPQIGFLCNNLQLNSTGNLTLTVGNNGGQNLVITGLGCSNSSSTPTTFSPVLLTLGQDQSKQVTFECQLNSQNIGSSFKGSLWVQLNNGQEEELGSTSATVSTGSPTGVPGSNGQGIIYISNLNYPSNLIQLNLVNGNIINSISLGQTPLSSSTSISLEGQDIYIVNQRGGQLTVGNITIYDTQTNQLSSINSQMFNYPSGIAFSGSNAYITNQGGGEFYYGNVPIYNTQTNQFSSIDSLLFKYPSGITFYGSNAYITNQGGGESGAGNVLIYNTQTNQFSSIDSPLFDSPRGITFYGSNAYIINDLGGQYGAGNIIIYNTQTNQFSSIDSPLFESPLGISFLGANAYITNQEGGESGSGNLIIYNTQTNQFSSIDSQLFDYPYGIDFSGSNAYITNEYGGLFEDGNLLLLNTLNNAITDPQHFTNNNMLYEPYPIVLSGGLGYFIGKQYGQYSLFTFNPFNNAVNRTASFISDFDSPGNLAIYNNNLYIINQEGGEFYYGNVLIYNTQNNQFSSINSNLFYFPSGISFSGSTAYITNTEGGQYGTGNLILYNTQNNQFSSIDSPLFDSPLQITFSGPNAYMLNKYGGEFGTGNLIIYNTQTNQFSSFDSPDFDYPTYMTKSGSDIYIYNSGNILVFNPSQNTIVNSITTLPSSNFYVNGMSNT